MLARQEGTAANAVYFPVQKDSLPLGLPAYLINAGGREPYPNQRPALGNERPVFSYGVYRPAHSASLHPAGYSSGAQVLP